MIISSFLFNNEFFRKFKREKQFKPLYKFLEKKKFSKVLEIGSGNGLNSLKTRVNCKEFIATDISKNKFIDKVIDVRKMPFKKNEFDLVLCIQVLEHIPNFWVAVEELKRVTKNYLIISVPFIYPEHLTPTDFYRFTEYGLNYLFDWKKIISFKTMNFKNFYSSITIVYKKNN